MPQNEITNNRPKNYSKWHRILPDWCYNTDGDFFEQRIQDGKLTAIAYIETVQIPDNKKPDEYDIWDHKKRLAEQINKVMGIPCFYVWHYANCKTFFVQRVGSDKIVKMYENEYKEFIKKLN